MTKRSSTGSTQKRLDTPLNLSPDTVESSSGIQHPSENKDDEQFPIANPAALDLSKTNHESDDTRSENRSQSIIHRYRRKQHQHRVINNKNFIKLYCITNDNNNINTSDHEVQSPPSTIITPQKSSLKLKRPRKVDEVASIPPNRSSQDDLQ